MFYMDTQTCMIMMYTFKGCICWKYNIESTDTVGQCLPPFLFPSLSRSTTQWWDSAMLSDLPMPLEETRKSVSLLMPVRSQEPKVWHQGIRDL